ncbi:hypothetical protein V2I01_18970 [Micromonospora sp. BRA006-A]|nr:hypothetical protein [Micromonospora sp. BRA006-A]
MTASCCRWTSARSPTAHPDAVDMARRLVELFEAKKIRRSVLAAEGMHGDSGARAMREALADSTVDLACARYACPRPAGASVPPPSAWPAASGTAWWSGVPRRTPESPRGNCAPPVTAARSLRRRRGRRRHRPGANAAAVEGAYAVHPACLDVSAATATTTAQLARRTSSTATRSGTASARTSPRTPRTRSSSWPRRRDGDEPGPGPAAALLQAQTVEGIAGGYAFSADRHGGMEPELARRVPGVPRYLDPVRLTPLTAR